MTSDAEKRRRLLASLERYNQALMSNEAKPLVTVDDVDGMPLHDLAVIVEATSHHLADIVQTLRWLS